MTSKFRKYIFKFACRILIFTTVFVLYLTRKDLLTAMLTQDLKYGVTPLHVLWAAFMCIMISHLFPGRLRTMALLKSKDENFDPDPAYSEFELLKFVQDMNRKAWRVMLVWLSGNAVAGLLYCFAVIHEEELFLLTVFFFLCDYICILLFCPFQTFIMKNRCCVNCRIYDWGHFMMFTPMLFIRNFFSWSLFFTSCIVLIRWELVYAAHPERFWYGSNRTLRCENCRDRTCRMKKALAGMERRK